MRKNMMLILLPTLLLASCRPHTSAVTEPSEDKNSDTTVDTTEVKEGYIKNPTTISIWTIIGQNNRPTFERAIEDFKKIEPNVTIDNHYESTNYNGLKDKVIKGFAGNDYPDIVQCYPDHVAEYLNYGKAVRLDPYMDNAEYGWTAEEKADIVTNFLEEGQGYTQEGTYSLPNSKSTEAMFYNADVLLGLNLATIDPSINGGKAINEKYLNNLTWEELFGKLAPAILKYNDALPKNQKILNFDVNDNKSAFFAYDSDDNLFITLAEQYGIGYTSVDKTTGQGKFDFVDDETAKSQMEAKMLEWNGYAKKGYIMTKGSADNKYTNEFFTANKSLFSVGSTGGVKYQYTQNFKTGVAKIPHAEGHDPKVINQGPSLCVLDHGSEDRKLASWLFYKYLTNKKNTVDWSIATGYSPIRKSAYDDDKYNRSIETTGQAYSLNVLMANCQQYVQTVVDDYYISPAFLGSSAARSAGAAIMTRTINRKEKALTKEAVDALFDEARTTCHKAIA